MSNFNHMRRRLLRTTAAVGGAVAARILLRDAAAGPASEPVAIEAVGIRLRVNGIYHQLAAIRGVIALSAQGAADPFATSPPAQFPKYPNGPCGGGYGAKHQNWAFDTAHGDFIVGGGDTTGDSQVDLFTYNAATRQFAMLLSAAQAGAGASTFDHSIGSLSITSGGAGYAPGYRPNYYPGMPGIALHGGSGTEASALIHVSSGGVVDNCSIYDSGYGFTVGDVLTANVSDLGGAGSGFSATVTSVSPAGTRSSISGPVGRCLPGYAYDTNRSVLWMEGGVARAGSVYPGGFANNLVKGGLWALDRRVNPPVWHRQGPGSGESAAGVAHNRVYEQYSSGLYFDATGDALYAVWGNIYKCSLNGISIDDVSRDMWSFHSFPPGAAENHGGFHAYDSARRRIIFWSPNAKKTYAWNCATDTYSLLGDWDPPFNNDWHMTYDANADRVLCWIAGQYGAPYDGMGSPGYYGDYQGRRSHVMYQMDPEGHWTSFTPAGDQLIAEDCLYAQVSGAYDPVNKCTVMMAANESSDATRGAWFNPMRLVVYHLTLPR